MSILANLQRLEQTTGRNDKIALVQQLIEQDPVYLRMFRDALDPLYNYGIQSIPSVGFHHNAISFEDALIKIERLRHMHNSNELINTVIEILSLCSEENATVIGRVLLKDLRCGVQIATVNKAIDNHNKYASGYIEKIFDYPCMLTSAYSEKLAKKLFAPAGIKFCQQKCDGMRFNAVVDEDCNVTFYGRSGKQINIVDDRFYELFKQFGPSVVVDGELLIDGTEDGCAVDRKIGNGILNKAVRGTITEKESKRITATLWDIIPLDAFKFGSDPTPYAQRFERLNNALNTIERDNRLFIVRTEKVETLEQAMDMFNEMIDHGFEGVIVKSPKMIWKNVRSTECMKIKAEQDIDARVIGVQPGTGRFEGKLGALLCETDDHKIQFKVGTGFTEAERDSLNTNDIIGKIVTVQYNMRIKDKNRPDVDSLFLPRFVEVRLDKDVTSTDDQVL